MGTRRFDPKTHPDIVRLWDAIVVNENKIKEINTWLSKIRIKLKIKPKPRNIKK